METVFRGEGRIARVRNKLLHFAVVQLEVRFSAEETSIVLSCQGPDDWKQGALVGVASALATCIERPCLVTVTKIEGTFVDTNPTIVGGAAIQALWSAVQHIPTPEQREHVDHQVFQSFSHAIDDLPVFHF